MEQPESRLITSPQQQASVPPLPLEVAENIISFIPRVPASQPTLHACTLLSRVWYAAAIARLYEEPAITGRSYDKFTKSICPSINAHIRKNGLAEFVRVLDLSMLVHHGSKSLTARLLGRVKVGLEEFIAPQASFGINALAALSKCARLRYLDLSLVSEAFSPHELSHTLRRLRNLKTLRFPRAGSQSYSTLFDCLPGGVQECIVTGGLRSYNAKERLALGEFAYAIHPPTTLTRFTIGNCDQLRLQDIEWIVATNNMPHLEYLEVEKQIPRVMDELFTSSLLRTSNIRHLCVPLDLLSLNFWLGDPVAGFVSCIDTLESDCVRCPEYPLDWDLIFDAVADGQFRNLRRLNLHRDLAQKLGTVAGSNELNLYLKALAREDGKDAKYSENQAGIWLSGK